MKKIKNLSLVFALVAATTFVSCSKDDAPAPVAPPAALATSGSYVESGSADNAPFTTILLGQSAATAQRIGSPDGDIITVAGTHISLADTSGSRTIAIVLEGITEPGTYTLNNTSRSVMTYVLTTNGDSQSYATNECSGSTGTITVTMVDATKIEGTFNFTGKNEACSVSKSVASGTFRGIFQ